MGPWDPVVMTGLSRSTQGLLGARLWASGLLLAPPEPRKALLSPPKSEGQLGCGGNRSPVLCQTVLTIPQDRGSNGRLHPTVGTGDVCRQCWLLKLGEGVLLAFTVGARGAAQHFTVHRTVPHEESPVPKCQQC